MLELDGIDGGGQLVRTAASLSAATGRPFRMENVRGRRSTPGLKPQHVAAVRAVADATDAVVTGDELGSRTLTFSPGRPRGGEVRVDVGTAGSATLVCDALFPLAVALDAPLSVTVAGGTDVRWAPSLDYLRRAKLPILRRAGLRVDCVVRRRGFYPVGGGELRLELRPSAVGPIRLGPRVPPERVAVRAVAAESLADATVAERLRDAAAERLLDGARTASDGRAADGFEVDGRAEYAASASPGAVATLVAECGPSRAGFVGLGRKGTPAEAVAAAAVAAFESWREGEASVDAHMSDQLAPWVALAGGSVRVSTVTDHLAANVDVIRAFGFDATLDPVDGGAVLTGPTP